MMYTVSHKNDTDVAHYNFHADQPILLLLAGNSYSVWAIINVFNFSCPFAITSLICWEIKRQKWRICLFSHAVLYTVSKKRHCFGLLYLWHSSTNFNDFFVVVLLSTLCKYYFSPSHFGLSTLPSKSNRPTVRHNFRVHVSPGSAETLVMRGGITNHHLIAYSLIISAKNYQNQLLCVEVIVCNMSVVFRDTMYKLFAQMHNQCHLWLHFWPNWIHVVCITSSWPDCWIVSPVRERHHSPTYRAHQQCATAVSSAAKVAVFSPDSQPVSSRHAQLTQQRFTSTQPSSYT